MEQTNNIAENNSTPSPLFKVMDAVEFTPSDSKTNPIKKTYIYSVNGKHQYPYIVECSQGFLLDDELKAELISDGYDVSILVSTSKARPNTKYIGVTEAELRLLDTTKQVIKPVAAPEEMITFVFPKSKWLGVVGLMEGQAHIFENQKMLLMLQPGMTEDIFTEMNDLIVYFIAEAKKV